VNSLFKSITGGDQKKQPTDYEDHSIVLTKEYDSIDLQNEKIPEISGIES
jgi:hypothetical protein